MRLSKLAMHIYYILRFSNEIGATTWVQHRPAWLHEAMEVRHNAMQNTHASAATTPAGS